MLSSVASYLRRAAALSASPRARTAGGDLEVVAVVRLGEALNQASPSRPRRRACQSGCSDDASCIASSISEFSRFRPKAARRLSISVSACSIPAHNRCRAARRAGPPARCSGHGDATARRRLHRIRRVFQARTGARSANSRYGFGPGCVRPTAVTCTTSEGGGVERPRWRSTSASAREHLGGVEVEPTQKSPPAGRNRHPFPGSVNSACRPVHRGARGSVGENRGARTTGQKPEAVIPGRRGFRSAGPARNRAAASSIASGIPSRCDRSRLTAAALSSVTARSAPRMACPVGEQLDELRRASDSTAPASSPPRPPRSAHRSSPAGSTPARQLRSSQRPAQALASRRCSQFPAPAALTVARNRREGVPSSGAPG